VSGCYVGVERAALEWKLGIDRPWLHGALACIALSAERAGRARMPLLAAQTS
jgi:hypothetical protein